MDGADQRRTAPRAPVSALARSRWPRCRSGVLTRAWRAARDRDPRLSGLGACWPDWQSVLAGLDDRAGGLSATGSAGTTPHQSVGGNPRLRATFVAATRLP